MVMRPLVGVTADRRWEEQANLLRRRGMDVLHGPTMRTIDRASNHGLREVTVALIASPPHSTNTQALAAAARIVCAALKPRLMRGCGS